MYSKTLFLKSTVLFLCLLLAGSTSISQTIQWEWAKQYGGGSNDAASQLVVSSDGSVFRAYHFNSISATIAGTSMSSTGGSNNIHLVKQNAAGNVVWIKTYSSNNPVSQINLVIDNNDNLYISAIFTGNFQWETTTLTGGGMSIAKIRAGSGNLVWARAYAGITNAHVFGAGNDNSLGIRIQNSNPGISFGGIPLPQQSFILTKLDTAGINALWVRTHGIYFGKFYLDNQGNVLMLAQHPHGLPVEYNGVTVGTMDPATPGVFISSSGSACLLKVSTTGNFLWMNQSFGFPDNLQVRPFNLGVDDNNDVYVVGAKFTTSTVNVSFAVRFSATGTRLYTEQLNLETAGQTGSNQISYGIACKDNRLYIANGRLEGEVYYSLREFVATSTGLSMIWFKKIPLANYTQLEFVQPVLARTQNALYIGGYITSASQAFDQHTVINAGGNDLYMAKLFLNSTVYQAYAGSDRVLCSGTSSTLLGANSVVGAGTGPFTYAWTPAAGLNNPNLSNPTATPILDTTQYTLTVTDQSNGSTRTDTVQVIKSSATPPPATPIITASGATTFCTGDSVTLTSSVAGQYLWSNGATTQSIKVFNTGAYFLQVKNAAGCESPASASSTVLVRPAPLPIINGSNPSGNCLNGSAGLNLTAADLSGGTPAATILWSTGATTQGITLFNPGITMATVTMSIGANCQNTYSQAVAIGITPTTPVITQNGNELTSSATTGNQWYLNNVLIPGATAQTLTITQSGSYKVIVSSGFCSASSAAQNVTFTRVLELDNERFEYRLYPNPAKNDLNLYYLLPSRKTVSISVYDLTGKRVAVIAEGRREAGGPHTENLSQLLRLGAGTYWIRMLINGKVVSEKLIITR